MKKNITVNRFLTLVLVSFAILASPMAQAQSAAKVLQANDTKPYTYVEQMPQFKGGDTEMMKFLGSNIRYPQEAQDAGLEGLVVLSFVVEKDGTLQDIEILKKLGGGTDKEAARVVKLMDGLWTPGEQDGKLVAVRYTLPIRFALSEAERAATAAKANQMAQFKGGPEALVQTMQRHLQLPAEAAQENLDARVVVKFTVEKDGSVSNIKLEQTKLKKTVGPGSELDYMDAATFGLGNRAILAKLSEAAITALKATSGQWRPSLKDGQPVAAKLLLPVQFLGSNAAEAPRQLDVSGLKEVQKLKDVYKYDEVNIKPTLKDMPLEKFLAKNLRFPAASSFEGNVKVHLLINKNGKQMGPLFSTAVNDERITDEITRVFKLTKRNWIPAQVDGDPVSSALDLTIRFIIDDGKKKKDSESDSEPDVVVTEMGAHASASKGHTIDNFLAENLRYPATQAEGIAIVKFGITKSGSLHYEMSPGFDDKMADEVLRVLKLAKDKGLLVHQQNQTASAMPALTISFTKNENEAHEKNGASSGADVVITKYAPVQN
ncbi:TonB family protein [Pontibacter sp. 172403-2]|uniref:TonB family protein n=1 Tax=Pontibacter rufus TaxID=2791028 RepID=UPI0018AF75AE|nr:TonB family protein [Pontibacter sp. 172403-2]MBF9252821.1 TonB family protein [Pontibacter sp. 172403-2]